MCKYLEQTVCSQIIKTKAIIITFTRESESIFQRSSLHMFSECVLIGWDICLLRIYLHRCKPANIKDFIVKAEKFYFMHYFIILHSLWHVSLPVQKCMFSNLFIYKFFTNVLFISYGFYFAYEFKISENKNTFHLKPIPSPWKLNIDL